MDVLDGGRWAARLKVAILANVPRGAVLRLVAVLASVHLTVSLDAVSCSQPMFFVPVGVLLAAVRLGFVQGECHIRF